MSGNPQEKSGFPFLAVQPGKDQIPVAVISVEKKAVVSVPPHFSGEQSDILGLDGENIAAAFVIKCLNFRITLIKMLPDHIDFRLILQLPRIKLPHLPGWLVPACLRLLAGRLTLALRRFLADWLIPALRRLLTGRPALTLRQLLTGRPALALRRLLTERPALALRQLLTGRPALAW